jgi:KUP system potassium uptake protein
MSTQPCQKSFGENCTIAVAALGVVFGDIGTSILYTFQECFHGTHPVPVDSINIIGLTSLILWSLLLVVTLKYVWILMNAENKGEGGILTLMSLVPLRFRHKKTGTLALASLFGIAGASLLFGDGIITPAMSVLSAMEGLELANPAYEKIVMPGTIAILAGLFYIQHRGTGKIGNYFGVIVLVWFIVAGALGLKFILKNPAILVAFDPRNALIFFNHEGFGGLKVLGSVILAVTGGEALYADMGHFGRTPIRLAWHIIVLPALMLNYLGQGALLLMDPSTSTRPFYNMVEQGPLYYALVVLATMATIIASQALITGAFSLTHQAIRLNIFPRVKTVHTSEELEGRVYVPWMNWLLAISCITIVILFKKSTNLAAAYGLAVSGTMFLTSLVFFYVCYYRWKWKLPVALLLVSFMLILDGAFLVATADKIPDGGYLPLLIGVFFFASMVIWQFGRTKLSEFYRTRSKTLEDFFTEIETKKTRRIQGTIVALSSNESKMPPVLARLVDTMHVIHEHVLLVTVQTADDPFVNENERARVTDLKHGVTRVILRYGFMETPDIPSVLARQKYTHLDQFPENEALYLLGKETFIIDGESFLERLRQFFFSIMSRNSSSASDYFNLPTNQVLELGAQLSV